MERKKPKPRKSKLEKAHFKKKIIQDLASGLKTQEQVAQEVGITQPAISRFAAKGEIKAMIEQEQQRLLSTVPDIIEQMARDIKTSNELSKVIAGELEPEASKAFNQLKTVTITTKGDTTSEKEDIGNVLKNQELAYKKQSDILKAAGLLPSNTTSIMIQNIINPKHGGILSPVIEKILSDRFPVQEPACIDIEAHEIIVD